MTAGKQTMAGAYSKIDSHERECALRYAALEGAIGGVKGETEVIMKHPHGAWGARHDSGQPDRLARFATLWICAAGHRGSPPGSGRAGVSDRRNRRGGSCLFKALAGRN